MFFRYALLFVIGSVAGWVIELFFRRFVSAKKWINPGFLNGPYLPMYGFGVCVLYAMCSVQLHLAWKIVFIVALMTLLEYITGLIFIKGMKIRLWDYSDRWGNIQGIICPLFSLFWGVLGVLFLFFLYPPLHTAAIWVSETPLALFPLGIFYGVIFVDLCISFNVSLKIRNAAVKLKEVVHYEELKATIAARKKERKIRVSYMFPFSGEQSIKEHIEEMLKKFNLKKDENVAATEEPTTAEQQCDNEDCKK